MQMRRFTQLALALIYLSFLWIASSAHAVDDTSRFKGQWKAAFFYNNVWVNIVSIHDDAGFKNYVIVPEGAAPVGTGTFSAANGKWSAQADAPNDSGTYEFIDNNTASCKNAIGQTLVWTRDNAPLPKIVGAAGAANGLPKDTNFAKVKVSQAVEVCRKLAQAWKPDAALVCVNVFGCNPDGTVNILANPQAFTLTFGSPSAKAAYTVVSVAPAGTFAPKPDAILPTGLTWLPISPKAIDLTEAFDAVRKFGFNGPITQARLYLSDKNDKPIRLVWSLEAGGAYPWIVSGASGAILSPFEVLDDKVADYNKLAAETAAAISRMRARQRHHGAQGAGGAWAETGMHYWGEGSHEGGGGSGGGATEEDTWDNEVAAQNAWEDGNSDAEARYDAGEPTVQDVETYGGGSGE